ncbi:MAG: gamma-glutamyltransferase, partial [Cyanobium sp.]
MTQAKRARLAPAALALLAAKAAVATAPATANVLAERDQRFHPVVSAAGIVAAEQREAMAVGATVLRRGGNAVDAAVATAFAQAVTLPYAGNLGGGGFLLLWLPGSSPAAARSCPVAERRVGRGYATAVNFRETAPRAARPEGFLGPDGRLDRRLATRSLRAAAVPGSVAGLLLAQRCYGRLPRRAVLEPAIALAERGFPVGHDLSRSLAAAAPVLGDDPGARALFFRPSAAFPGPSAAAPLPLQPGDRLRQPQLAVTLRRIAARGEPGFYEGPVAEALTALMRARGGWIDATDLRAYRARLVEPLAIEFRGHRLLAMPPPGGGLTLLQLLKLMEPSLEAAGLDSAAGLHRLAEAMALAFRDRNAWLGDPDQSPIPVRALLSPPYLEALRRSIDPRRHTPSEQRPAPPPLEGSHTTHLSVADRQGGMASLTTTLNLPYGNGVLVPGAGFL